MFNHLELRSTNTQIRNIEISILILKLKNSTNSKGVITRVSIQINANGSVSSSSDNNANSGGIYATPTTGGSRSGALIATAWATMLYHGRSGYIAKTRKVVSTTRSLAEQYLHHHLFLKTFL